MSACTSLCEIVIFLKTLLYESMLMFFYYKAVNLKLFMLKILHSIVTLLGL